MVIALMLGRKGSQGFPGKNTFPILGRPMMIYPLIAALEASLVDDVYVSTDSDEIRNLTLGYGAKIIDRPPELASKKALGEDAYVHGYRHICNHLDEKPKLLVLLFCNAATILAQTIDEGIQTLQKDPTLDSAVTVSAYNMWSPIRARKLDQEGLLQPFIPFETFGNLNSINCDRDSQGEIYFADMSVSIVRAKCLENLDYGILPQRWMGRRIHPLIQWGGCDVDFEWQVPTVEYWLKKNGFTESKTPYSKKE